MADTMVVYTLHDQAGKRVGIRVADNTDAAAHMAKGDAKAIGGTAKLWQCVEIPMPKEK
jgi:hypothetical protein